jgi:CDP-6-deoxy-D-xylo-4-hexulose-3-dehydrase
LDSTKYFTEFKLEGASNYAFNLILKENNREFCEKLMNTMRSEGIEFRRGSAGGGNQLRQPYMKKRISHNYYRFFPNTEHIHFYGFYIGNFPTMQESEVDEIVKILNGV